MISKILIYVLFTIVLFLFTGIVLYVVKWKKRGVSCRRPLKKKVSSNNN